MTAKETFKTIAKHQGLVGIIRFFFPLRIVRHQILVMKPSWYNGHFSMKSINKLHSK
jgi:hypothetical protein